MCVKVKIKTDKQIWTRSESLGALRVYVRLSKSQDHRAPLFTAQVHRDRSPSRSPKRRVFICGIPWGRS